VIDTFEPLTETEVSEIVDEVANIVVSRRLETPAILFLEMQKPLSYVASQGAVLAAPILGQLLGIQRMARYARFMNDRGNIDRLIARVDELSCEREARRAAQQ
jgi:hypothetical protein